MPQASESSYWLRAAEFLAVFERKRPFLSKNQVQCRENIKNKMWPKVAFVCEQFSLTHATGRENTVLLHCQTLLLSTTHCLNSVLIKQRSKRLLLKQRVLYTLFI